MAKVGIVYGSNAGDTKVVAEYIGQGFDSEVIDAKDLTIDFLIKYDKLIFAASTHGHGELQKDFRAKLDIIAEAEFGGKTLALVGVGGQVKHPTTFLDGLVEFLPLIRGAKLVGATDIDGYVFKNSLSFINGKFIGLAIDYKNDKDWQARADKWIESIKSEF
ncbi:flavodoxin [Campylobacter devanensis]|uniref:Flavodoxin n=1 Tax=Campylobacter devanensis TaxID=3161138 RepID=A0A1X9SSA5_9BACT|nr:flavodoxin domain-containing protein [Campylobacter lanienae]ARQ99127.1 flavodoxin, long chain type [Campylobacter lanienae]SUX02292.1 flavodoxin [Campylobacter lanienae]